MYKEEPVEYKGLIPAKSVAIPGTYNKNFPSGNYGVPCALIIGKRKDSTNKKTSLNEALRDIMFACNESRFMLKRAFLNYTGLETTLETS